MSNSAQSEASELPPVAASELVPRGLFGGLLMGLANLVPGISGGTMLLAVGIYPRFIESVARATSLRFDRVTVLTLGSVGVAAVGAIGLLAGTVKGLVIDHRWIMYSIFIGLTLGGVPVVGGLIRDARRSGAGDESGASAGNSHRGAVWGGAAVGFVLMAGLAWFQMQGAGGGSNSGWLIFLLGGMAGAAAMILPGVSGGYLLLVLGAYVPILGGIDDFRAALSAADVGGLISVGVAVILPVGLGVLVGIAGVSHALRWLLARYELATLGALMGLLVGAVVGLWPFQDVRLPQPGDLIKGQTVEVVVDAQALAQAGVGAIPGQPAGTMVRFSESGEAVEIEDLPTAVFSPSGGQMGLALTLIILGFGTTTAIGRFGAGKPE